MHPRGVIVGVLPEALLHLGLRLASGKAADESSADAEQLDVMARVARLKERFSAQRRGKEPAAPEDRSPPRDRRGSASSGAERDREKPGPAARGQGEHRARKGG